MVTSVTWSGTEEGVGGGVVGDYRGEGCVGCGGVGLPSIWSRPGKPNKAASSFFSGSLRGRLAGVEAICPVDDTVRHWVASPRAATGFLIHAATIDADAVGPRRTLAMPGLCVTIREMLDSLRRIAGDTVADRVKFVPDDFIRSIVSGWPENFAPERALALGFTPDPDFDSIIRSHIDEELGGRVAG